MRYITLPIDLSWVEDQLAKVQNYSWLYEWGMYFFLLATLGICIWVFFDSTNKNKGDKALIPRILSMVGVFLIAPAFIFKFTGNVDNMHLALRLGGEPGSPLFPGPIAYNVRWLVNGYGSAIAMVALLGVIVSVVAVVVYSSTVQRARPSTEFMGALNSKFSDIERSLSDVKRSGSASAPTVGPAGQAPSGGAASTIIDRKPAAAAATIIDRPASGATLKAVGGPEDGRVWNLPASDVKIGRDSTSFIVINGGKASREHAKLLYNGGAWAAIDLGSSNGTYHNNAPVSGQVALADGDLLRIGDSTFLFAK